MDATTSVPPLSNKVFSLALALPILGQSPSRSQTRPKTGLFSSAAGWNHWTWVRVGEHVQAPLILCRGAQTQSLPNPKLASTSGQRALCPPTPCGREAVRNWVLCRRRELECATDLLQASVCFCLQPLHVLGEDDLQRPFQHSMLTFALEYKRSPEK